VYNHKGLAACIVACLSVSIALACGPDFPWQLLDDRAGTLKATPANSFAFEAARLAPTPRDQLKATEGQLYTAEAETEGLSTDQAARVRQMREADNGEEAFDRGVEIPLPVRLYTAGAVEFNKGEVTRAASWFQAILQLSDNDQHARATWAAYMLGRSYGLAGDVEKAAEAFSLTRNLAINGAPDPLGLAVASYGEEAKLHLDQANGYLTGDELPETETAGYTIEIATAVALYAEQAARGSRSGIDSLRIVAEQLLSTPTRVAAAAADPIVQRLLVTYVLARLDDRPLQSYASDPAEDKPGEKPNLLLTLVEAIEQRGLDHLTGADRLAALAYGIGRYDLAARLAAQVPGPLASWVKAKLAFQRGELAAAAAFYAEASQAFPSSDEVNPLDEGNVRLLAGEGGVLALARDEYVDALAQLYPVASTYWGDVAHLAERVLTVDELKRFVDAKVPALSVTNPQQSRAEGGMPSGYTYWLATDPAAQLRDLLARRLVREGRYEEALRYFHAPDDSRFSPPDAKKHVADYAQALHAAKTSWWAIDRARAWYQAAVLARKSGMKMMGYEAAPDFFAVAGNYSFGIGQNALAVGDEWVTDGERQRFSASTAKPDERYHYRYIAVDHVTHAADLLPPRSQAFAAVLCQATGWMMSTAGAQERVRDLYRRYVKQGPYMARAAHFGRNCPEPDFAAAVHLARIQPFRNARQVASHYRWPIGLGLVGILSLALTWLVRQYKASADYGRQS
jgi:hypothetical protein